MRIYETGSSGSSAATRSLSSCRPRTSTSSSGSTPSCRPRSAEKRGLADVAEPADGPLPPHEDARAHEALLFNPVRRLASRTPTTHGRFETDHFYFKTP